MNSHPKESRLVTVGEVLAVLAAPEPGPPAVGARLRLGLAGAESKVAVSVSRLGGSAVWIGRVSEDALGELTLREFRAEGVTALATRDSASHVAAAEGAAHGHAQPRALLPHHTVGSRLSVRDIPEDVVAGAAVLHITGITPALGTGPALAVRRAVDIAVAAKVPVSLDINFRSLLWTEAEARQTPLPLLRMSDVVFAGTHEARLMAPHAQDHPEGLAKGICELGSGGAVLKLGAEGAFAIIDGRPYRQPAVPVTVHDSTGAGDAFAAGYLAELLAGEPPERRLRTAALLDAFAVSTTGDWEGLPRRSELALLDHHDDVVR